MPQGTTGISKASKDIEARKAAGTSFGPSFLRVKVQSGKSEVVRFLEEGDDIFYAWGAYLEPTGRQRVGNFVVSRDQERNGSVACPLVEAEMPIKFKGYINVIWRNGPIYKMDKASGRFARDSNNEMIQTGKGDILAVIEQGITFFEQLVEVDKQYGGLRSRDFKIKRQGASLDTKYFITPAHPDDGPAKMLAADRKMERNKIDLKPLVTPRSYEEIETLMGTNEIVAKKSKFSPVDHNPFSDDEESDDDE